jgi:glycosyltransferase involved in cell wall biosynthesis
VEIFLPGPGKRDYRRGAKTVMGYVGVIGQQEGMDLLVQAAEHLIKTLGHGDVHFLIIGFGPTLEEVKADVAARGLEGHFTFTGPLFGEDMLAALNAVDIGVSPDPKNAMNDISTMNKVMEYMTLEKPVVQFDLTEGRASAGEASVYARANDPVDFAGQIAWLIDNPEKAAEMGRIGRTRVLEKLSWQHSVPHLLAAYDRVFAKRR